jgi:hypothetical protein
VDDLATALGLAANSSVPSASATVASGVGVQVRVIGDDATLLALSDGGGIGANGGLLRDGLSIELLFDRDRPVSMTRIVLGSWDASVDSARLDVMNRDDAAPAVQLSLSNADSTLDEASVSLRDGFTRYVLVAGAGAEFSLKSFAFVDRGAMPSPTSSSDDGANVTSDALLGTTEIALIAAGGALLFCIAGGLLAACLIRRRRQQQATSSDNATPLSSVPTHEMQSFVSFRGSEYGAMAPMPPSSAESNYGAMAPLATMQEMSLSHSQSPTPFFQYALAPRPSAPPATAASSYDDPENVREQF